MPLTGPAATLPVMDVSVLICTRDRPESLLRCIASALNQSHPPLEVVVLDDAPARQRAASSVRSALSDQRIRLLRVTSPVGIPAARNLLVSRARGEVFCFLDDDAYFAHPDALRLCVQALRQNPDVGALAFRALERTPTGERLLVPFGRRALRRDPGIASRCQLVAYYIGCGHAIRRSTLDRVGHYDDKWVYYGEELDMAYRMVEAGLPILYVPSILVRHDALASAISPRFGPEMRLVVRNRVLLAYRHIPWPYIGPYVLIWLTVHAIEAARRGELGAYIAGLRSALRAIKKERRVPLSKHAVWYLVAHHGRLWY